MLEKKKPKMGFWDRFRFYNDNKMSFGQILSMEHERRKSLDLVKEKEKKDYEDEYSNP